MQSTPELITSSDPRSLRRDENNRCQETPKNGFWALRHQERRRREFRQNSRALRSAALQRARDALSEDLHEAEAQEVRIVSVLMLLEFCAGEDTADRRQRVEHM